MMTSHTYLISFTVLRNRDLQAFPEVDWGCLSVNISWKSTEEPFIARAERKKAVRLGLL